MTVARLRKIDLDSTPGYQLINRCVRQGLLCGEQQLPPDIDHFSLRYAYS